MVLKDVSHFQYFMVSSSRWYDGSLPLATVFRCNQYQIGGRKWGAKGVAQHKLAEIKSALVVRASWKQSEKEFF